jgi:putative hemolysin
MIVTELLIVLGLTLLNGVLAMSEMALVSSRKARLEAMAAGGSRGARAAVTLAEDPSGFLSTVQIGITLVGIFAGAFSGATLAGRLGQVLDGIPFFAPHGHSVAIGVVVVGITFLSLVVGELVPKRIALARPEAIAALVAPPMRRLSLLATPAVWLLRLATDGLLAALGQRSQRDVHVSEEEVRALIAEGAETGVFDPREKEMIDGVLRLADRTVRAIMTPRGEIAWIDRSADRAEIARIVTGSHRSRLLVCDGAIDHALGVVHTKDLLAAAFSDVAIDLKRLMTPLVAIPDTTPVLKVIELFKRDAVHMVVIIDEYGTTEGIATPTDVLETIAGELPGYGEVEGPLIATRADGSWLVDGAMPIDEFRDRTGLRQVGRDGGYQTVAGLALARLGRIPSGGEVFEIAGFRFEIVDMDGRRIDKLIVSPPRAAEEA